MKVKEESDKAGLKLSIQKINIMVSRPIISSQLDGENMEIVIDLIFLCSKITADGDWSHEVKRCLRLGRKDMINLDSALKCRDINLLTKVCMVKAMVFPVVMYRCGSWTIKKAEHRRMDAFEVLTWMRLLRVLWTARRPNQSTPKEINHKYSLEGEMLKLKLQYFGHLVWMTDSLEKTLTLGKIEGRRRRGRQGMRWLDGIMSLNKVWEIIKDREAWHAAIHGVTKSQTQLSDWTRTIFHSACINLSSHQQYRRVPSSAHPLTFIVFIFFDEDHPDWFEMIPYCSFDRHFSNSDVEHLFMCLLAI